MLQVLGRLHPLLVHFPIALLLAALAAEWRAARAGKRAGPSEAGMFCLLLGALGASAAALSGWLFAEHDPPGAPVLLFRHRWAGVGAAAGAALTLLSAWRWKRGAPLARPTRAGLLLTAALTGAAGHLGGEMVYGEGFGLAPLRSKRSADPAPLAPASMIEVAERTDAGGTRAAPEPESGLAPAEPPVDYLGEVRPLLARHCFECHGEGKRPKGRLKLSDMGSVFAREADEPALVPGDPEASLVYRRIVLPPEDEDVMPPEGPMLSDAERELVRRWILAGAPWSEPPAETASEDPGAEPR